MEFGLVVNLETWASGESSARRTLRLDANVKDHKLMEWKLEGRDEASATTSTSSSTTSASADKSGESAKAALQKNFEFRLPLSWLVPKPTSGRAKSGKPSAVSMAPATRLKLRFSLWQNRIPVDALPMEGWIELQLLSEWELGAAM